MRLHDLQVFFGTQPALNGMLDGHLEVLELGVLVVPDYEEKDLAKSYAALEVLSRGITHHQTVQVIFAHC